MSEREISQTSEVTEDLGGLAAQHAYNHSKRKQIIMIVTIFALGSRGDVQPYVALGKGLKDAGHAVRVLTSQDFQELITTYGLDFFHRADRTIPP